MANAVPRGSSARSEQLDELALVAERVSHALRTPLSVVQSLIDDASSGVTLVAQDFEDGVGAVEKLRQLTTLLAAFSSTSEYPRELRLLYPLLLATVKDTIGVARLLASPGVQTVSYECSADALRELLQQLYELAGAELQLALVEKLGSGGERQLRLIAKFSVEAIPLKAYPQASLSLPELAVQNHGWQGLRMLLIERIATRAGWQIAFSCEEKFAELVIDL